MQTATASSALRRIPPEMQEALIIRGEWSFCAMEHSSLGAIQIADPGAPFHHLGLTLGDSLVRVGMSGDGRPIGAALGRGDMALIEAGVGGSTWWDAPYESACFYFTDDALSIALGCIIDRNRHALRTTMSFRSPVVRRLLKTLHADATAGQPHGNLIGDAVFVALADQLLAPNRDWMGRAPPGTPDWRVTRALEYIHAHLTRPLVIADVASAAGTSPFHLNRQFRARLGSSHWQYVLQERARLAFDLMQDPHITLTQVSNAAGFETYASFIDATRRTFGALPSDLRRQTC